tara:strand:+ start:972 stop:2837 length:1866 start_codon:yes stop_codon:yes gene_type:complete
MSLMRALRGVATGYLGARVDQMNALAKAKAEEKKFNDQLKAEETSKIKLINITNQNAINRELDKEKRITTNLRRSLAANGWTEDMLDILEKQGHLVNVATFNVWKKDYDNFYKDKKINNENIINFWTQVPQFQTGYIDNYNKGTPIFNSEEVVNNIKKENLPNQENTANLFVSKEKKSETTGQDIIKESTIISEGDTKVKPEGVDVLPSKDASKVSNWLTEGLDTAPEPRTKQFSLSVDDPDNPAWALSSIPHSALAKDGSEIMVLTLDNKSQQYVAKIEKVGKTYDETWSSKNTKDRALTTSLLRIPGLFPNKEDFFNPDETLNEIMMGTMSKPNRDKYLRLHSLGTLLRNSYEDAYKTGRLVEVIPISQVARIAHELDTAAQPTWAIKSITKIETETGDPATTEEKGQFILNDVKRIMTSIKNNVPDKDKDSIYKSMVQDYKQSLADKYDTNPNTALHQEYIKLVDDILADIEQYGKEPNSNPGAFWTRVPSDRDIEGSFLEDEKSGKFEGTPSAKSDIEVQTDEIIERPKQIVEPKSETDIKLEKELEKVSKIVEGAKDKTEAVVEGTKAVNNWLKEKKEQLENKETLTREEKLELKKQREEAITNWFKNKINNIFGE